VKDRGVRASKIVTRGSIAVKRAARVPVYARWHQDLTSGRAIRPRSEAWRAGFETVRDGSETVVMRPEEKDVRVERPRTA
jgi:hypothetical protein